MRYRMRCWATQLDRTMKPLGWHVWVSSGGTVNATSTMPSPYGLDGSGETIDAPSIPAMRRLLRNRVTA